MEIFCPQAKPDSWGFRKFVSGESLKNRAAQWLPGDCLTIVCDVSIIGEHNISMTTIFLPDRRYQLDLKLETSCMDCISFEDP